MQEIIGGCDISFLAQPWQMNQYEACIATRHYGQLRLAQSLAPSLAPSFSNGDRF
jgi:hypothetical protein